MKTTRCVASVLIALFALMVPADVTRGQFGSWVCDVYFTLRNADRAVVGAPWTECPGGIHSAPFGNWGVSSNAGGVVDGNQFEGWCNNHWGGDGWYCRDGWFEWNSCYSYAPPPNCNFFNAPGCVSQQTATGVNVHGGGIALHSSVSAPYYDDQFGGCRDFDTLTVTVAGNFMSLYEIDPWDADDFVQTLYFPDMSAALSCPNAWFCEGESGWEGVTIRDPYNLYGITSADARLQLRVDAYLSYQ